MRATISRCLHALKQRRSSDEGFSLIELIVVVAILGILVAIAIPVFTGLQDSAEGNSLKAVAANGATVVASGLASGKDWADATDKAAINADLAALKNADITAVEVQGDPTLDDICVKVTGYGAKTMFGGNGAKADGSACN
ncbi:MAG: prepilin-type N-terminal cleavage/methylation domain-containing protein [Propionibacteriaceae bacterium]|nr:prepilin-type N-terminal cleavage/methylation domain-containing protein [Propionibacteriaceae bacterium]